MSFLEELSKRRTFAIISHPDAGKTTLTEKFLLFSGAIKVAGAVKSNKASKSATSDFMEIEKQRGISVATSVMAFEYNGHHINLFDTPGHKDFAEDTYRTLTAVDSVILVIDCVKGVEIQTEKLMQVCRMRNTPVIIFVNKLDREGKDPYDLLDEIEEKLNIKVRPLSWPISMGISFQGVYNLFSKRLNLFRPNKSKVEKDVLQIENLNEPVVKETIGRYYEQLIKDVELIEGVYEPFDRNEYLKGKIAPVFFGSALNNFGVKELLESFIEIAPSPKEKETTKRTIHPIEKCFSGFVFKIHANLGPKHRDRIAFLRVCSGKFERNKFYQHTRLDKKLRFSSPVNFLAQEKNLLDEAYPGDVVGLYDSGNFKIGDTLTEGEKFFFKGIPTFSPEIFKELINKDPLKTKQLEKGIRQLTDEGVAQLFIQQPGNRKIIGTVGELQFDVIKYRLLHEYGASCEFANLNFYKACWIESEDKEVVQEFMILRSAYIVRDKDEKPVFLAESKWILDTVMQKYPTINFNFLTEYSSAALRI
ncbi:MAG: peptide chain release factor 3 [Cytophagaceae bacterium]